MNPFKQPMPSQKPPVKSVRFDDDLWWKFKEYCAKQRRPMSDVLQEIVKRELEKKK